MFGFLLLLFLVIPSAFAGQNPCHDRAQKRSLNCTEVKIPVGLCPVCGVAAPMLSDGSYVDCTRTSGLEDAVDGEQCLSLLSDYVNLNPCDDARLTALQLYSSTSASLKEKGRQRLDYFLYSICENGCDCVPQVGADPLVKAVDYHRGNCQAHTYYDICRILPNIKIIRRADDTSVPDVATLPQVCPLITDWFQNSGDGQDFLHKPSTMVDPNVEYFLNRLVYAEEMLSNDNALWDQCINLETLQGRINITASVETSSDVPSSIPTQTPMPTDTTPPTGNPSASPSGVPSASPSSTPSSAPWETPTTAPSVPPSGFPSGFPSEPPSSLPSGSQSQSPSGFPSVPPTSASSGSPSIAPSRIPTTSPSAGPTEIPSAASTSLSSGAPSIPPSALPSVFPSESPSILPTIGPSDSPDMALSMIPTSTPSLSPSPSQFPSSFPSTQSSAGPSKILSTEPSESSNSPSGFPSGASSVILSTEPSLSPSFSPTIKTTSDAPSVVPTVSASAGAIKNSSVGPSALPTIASESSSEFPSSLPSGREIPSAGPSESSNSPSMSSSPTISQSVMSSAEPSLGLSGIPSIAPSIISSDIPSTLSLLSSRPTWGAFEPVRISAGELSPTYSYEGVDGHLWGGDDYFNNTGNVFKWVRSIRDTDNDELYTTQRFGADMVYSVPVPSGEYLVKLHFAELSNRDVGLRVFDVWVEGTLVADKFDIYAVAGRGAAYVLETTVVVMDGFLEIDFIEVVRNPTIAAVEVIQLVELTEVPVESPSFEPSNLDILSPTSIPSPASLAPSIEPSLASLPSSSPTWGAFEPVRISAGELSPTYSYEGVDGHLWGGDDYFNNTGNVFKWVRSIRDTDNDELYTTQRFGADMVYSVPVPSGEYLVKLHFAELSNRDVGLRVFDVWVEGTLVADKFDIYAVAGRGAAYVLETTVVVMDGFLEIDFIEVVRNPTIAAVEVIQLAELTSPSQSSNPSATFQSDFPSLAPSYAPSTDILSALPSDVLSVAPSVFPSQDPSVSLTSVPTDLPSDFPSAVSSDAPSATPSNTPSVLPSDVPSDSPSQAPSGSLSSFPTDLPSGFPSAVSSDAPSVTPSNTSSVLPSDVPSDSPSQAPSGLLSSFPTDLPSDFPSAVSDAPSVTPSDTPSVTPSDTPSMLPSTTHDNPSSSPTFVPTVTIADRILINAGELSNPYTDVTATVWQPDQYFNNETSIGSTRKPIRWTVDDPIYKTWREGRVISYDIPLAPGDYEITLYFSENEYEIAGARFFDVEIEGVVVFYSLDIYKESGKERRAFSFDTVLDVIDGSLNIELVAIAGNAFICGIEVKRNGPHLAHSVPGGPYVSVDADNDGFALVEVDGSLSHTHAPDYDLIQWSWIFQGVEIASGKKSLLELPVGSHVVDLKVRDAGGNEADQITDVTVLPFGYPILEILSPSTGDVVGGDTVILYGDGFNYTASEIVVHFGSSLLSGPQQLTVINASAISVLATPAVVVGAPVQVKVETPIGESNVQFYTYVAEVPIIFENGSIASPYGPTRLIFGPDQKLYVATQTGLLAKYTLDENYTIIDSVVSSVIATSELPNYRTILGIAFDPTDTSENPTVYVAHSTLFHGSSESFTGVAINGKVSALSGPNLDVMTHVVTGLPVSDRDHAVNGLLFTDTPGELLIQVGGNTNAGVRGRLSGTRLQDDNVLSSATLVARLSSPDFNGTLEYNPDGTLRPGSGVEIYASGQRNSFDIVLHSNGGLYATDNGPNAGFGAESFSCATSSPDPTEPDKLNLIVPGNYYGQANRPRGECIWRSAYESSDSEYTAPLKRLPSSTNGIVEFETSHFGGQLRGNLVVGQYQSKLYRIVLEEGGSGVAFGPSVLAEEGGLDVTQGPDGTLWVCQIEKHAIVYHKPVEPLSSSAVVKAVFPRRGPIEGGNTLIIFGEHFAGIFQPSVSIGNKPCPVLSVSESQIRCVLPSGYGKEDAIVRIANVTAVFRDAYRYIGIPSESEQPSDVPSEEPSALPSDVPSDEPSALPSDVPSSSPAVIPSSGPSDTPSTSPSDRPTSIPSDAPSDMPTISITESSLSDPPSDMPSDAPSDAPSLNPSLSMEPSLFPSSTPSAFPPEWTTLATTGVIKKRHEACFVFCKGRAYLVGGRGLKPVTEFDPNTNTWSRKSQTPIELHHMQCVSVDDSIWIVSSWTGTYPNETNVADIYLYNTTTDSWSTRPGLPESRRRGGAAAVLVERTGTREIYVSHGNRGGHGNHSQTLGWLDRYNIDTNVWMTNLPDAPTPRDHTGGGLVQDGTLLCVAGGRDTGVVDFFDAVILPTDCYNLDTGTWATKADIPTSRAGASYGTTCDGKLMVAGGEGFGQAFDTVEVFDGENWETVNPLQQARHGSGLAVSCAGGCQDIYIASGSGNQGGSPELTSTELYSNCTWV